MTLTNRPRPSTCLRTVAAMRGADPGQAKPTAWQTTAASLRIVSLVLHGA